MIGQPIERHQLEGFAEVELTGKTPPPAKAPRPPRKPRGASDGKRSAASNKPSKQRRSGSRQS